MEKWQIVNSEKVFSADGRFDIYKQSIELPNGRIVDDFYNAKAQDFVVIYAQTQNKEILVACFQV
jgi:hypothetical protein